FAAPHLRDDREVVLKAVKKWGVALKHASPRLRADREVVMAAVKRNSAALKYASKQLCSEFEENIPVGRQLGMGATTVQKMKGKG
ncbi:MAG: DUF4116 domain-containing protein, partial [Pseudomonadota bacterium]|nr:DUF4116 domain-containing protein [Pseudomonadota bacterium]